MRVHSAKLPTGMALLLAIAVPCAAGAAAAAVEEIPVTTSVPAARMDFIAGRAALDKGDGPQANALFRAAVSADPDFTYAWLNLANASFSPEEFASSLKRAAASAANASEGERLLVEIAQRFLDANFEAQQASAKKLVAKYPRSQRALLALAAVEGNLARFDAQRAALKRAIELDPSFAPAHLALGNSYLFNQPVDARVVGTDEFSNIQEAQIAYLEGQLAARRGNFAEAERLAGRYAGLVAAQKNPRKMENHHELVGLTHLLQNRHREAVAEYRQANLTNIYVKYHLALALEGAGQTEEARALFREIGTNNFNTVGFALVRKDALARAG